MQRSFLRNLYLLVVVSLIAAPKLWADDVRGSDQLLCAVQQAILCTADSGCETAPPRNYNIPDFIEIDIANEGGEYHSEHRKVPAYVPWLVLAAIVVTYINRGAYWTYIELAALADNATPEWVGKVLVWTSFCSIVGCLFATVVSNRFGLARPLLVALVSMAIIVGMLAGGVNDTNIVISVFSFNFLWIFVDIW